MQFSEKISRDIELKCFHCGETCPNDLINLGDKYFCCSGCKLVYEILEENKLCKYYELDKKAGISLKNSSKIHASRFDFLDDSQVVNKLVDFTNGKISTVTFFVPQIHCSACIWLLENLHKLNKGIVYTRVDFLQKKLYVKFNTSETALRKIVELLASVGYEPKISLDDLEIKHKTGSNKKLYYKIGIAGFCFGNIMLLSFPEYLSLNHILDPSYRSFFGYLNILLALPVILYCSSYYFINAYTGLMQRKINIDFPISIGLSALFIRSVFEVITQTGPGFFDSLAGLVFFLLIGKVFQAKTFDVLNFERNYKSYFPISVTVKKSGNESAKPVSKLKEGDRIIIRNQELVPADAILFNGKANIDYSFVTGESIPVEKVPGEIIYAGGKQSGNAIELEVLRTVSASYFTQLWNNEAFVKRDETKFDSMVNIVGKYFTLVVLTIAFGAFIVWLPVSLSKSLFIFTSILIVACPCGIALTNPFVLGNAMRILAKNKLYVKNINVVERMSKINTIVFDKTGTITKPGASIVSFIGGVLSSFEQQLVKSLARNSTHPLSIMLCGAIKENKIYEIQNFEEHSGKGLEGYCGIYKLKLGSRTFVTGEFFEKNNPPDSDFETKIYLSINDENKGYFLISNQYRDGIDETIWNLSKSYNLSLLSGDNEGEKWNLLKFFNNPSRLHFRQSPEEKLNFIKKLQSENKSVLMLGDGLNDAGALKQSDVGITISEDITKFTPACDAIMEASGFRMIHKFLKFSRDAKVIIIISFIISMIYNVFGISLASLGYVTPILAAILMPLSSISVVLFTFLSTNIIAKKRGLK